MMSYLVKIILNISYHLFDFRCIF